MAQPAPVGGPGVSGRHRYRCAPKPVALQLKGVAKQYRLGDEQVNVLVEFDFDVTAGEFVVVTGPSGAGKSTLLHVAGGWMRRIPARSSSPATMCGR